MIEFSYTNDRCFDVCKMSNTLYIIVMICEGVERAKHMVLALISYCESDGYILKKEKVPHAIASSSHTTPMSAMNTPRSVETMPFVHSPFDQQNMTAVTFASSPVVRFKSQF